MKSGKLELVPYPNTAFNSPGAWGVCQYGEAGVVFFARRRALYVCFLLGC